MIILIKRYFWPIVKPVFNSGQGNGCPLYIQSEGKFVVICFIELKKSVEHIIVESGIIEIYENVVCGEFPERVIVLPNPVRVHNSPCSGLIESEI
ncbi:hypothetical protein MNBD_GAMMA11-2029 [hydrothermal vent metagenome]|uniref:Uncharacterized protein n=1 Tax=hydrothermal vent metagenome TaxID=652676 RepID=A0A3B0X9G0_9ZZZZ